MSKKRSKIVKELDPQKVEGYSKARIEHYLFLGYRPYLNEEGKIKWLTPAQKSLRGTAGGLGLALKRLLKPKQSKYYRHKRRRRSHLRSFLREHWLSILIMLLVAATILVLLLYPNLIF